MNEIATNKAYERTLLLVDDEANILSALARLFRPEGYRLLRAGGGAEGLKILEDNEVGVIISDQRMPNMTGVDFLTRVKELYPETVRVILSGYTDLNYVADAINQGAIYKFLTKPWDDDLLKQNVNDAFKHYDLKRENERLNAELQAANNELSSVNERLEKRVEEKTEEVMLNLRVLRLSQEVLEHLPAAVLGIGDDSIIAIANQKAHELLDKAEGTLVGLYAENVLDKELYIRCQEENGATNKIDPVCFGDKLYNVSCSRMGQTSHSNGRILVFIPTEQESI